MNAVLVFRIGTEHTPGGTVYTAVFVDVLTPPSLDRLPPTGQTPWQTGHPVSWRTDDQLRHHVIGEDQQQSALFSCGHSAQVGRVTTRRREIMDAECSLFGYDVMFVLSHVRTYLCAMRKMRRLDLTLRCPPSPVTVTLRDRRKSCHRKHPNASARRKPGFTTTGAAVGVAAGVMVEAAVVTGDQEGATSTRSLHQVNSTPSQACGPVFCCVPSPVRL